MAHPKNPESRTLVSPLASYRRLLGLAGPAYVAIAFLGRLPLAMSQIGTLLLVSTATGSYGAGGLAAGALAVANAVTAPLAGALADRVGQRPVVLVQSLAGAGLLALLVALVETGAPTAGLVVAAAAAGAALPQVGPLARVRWRPITAGAGRHQRRLVDAAFSYEGAADEASFAVGPALVGLGAVVVSPAGALLLAAGLLAVFGTAFALHPTARRAPAPAPGASGASGVAARRLVTGTLLVLGTAQLLVGVLFGSVQTGATVLATSEGRPGLAGLVHGTLGVGSAVAGLMTAGLPERVGHERRAWWAACALVPLSLPLLLVEGLVPLTVVVLVLGCAVAPCMIAVFSLAERVVDPGAVGAAMTLLASCTGAGYALGSGLAGRLADGSGHTAAFAVTVGGCVLAAVLTTVARGSLRRAVARADATGVHEAGLVAPVG